LATQAPTQDRSENSVSVAVARAAALSIAAYFDNSLWLPVEASAVRALRHASSIDKAFLGQNSKTEAFTWNLMFGRLISHRKAHRFRLLEVQHAKSKAIVGKSTLAAFIDVYC
jgi:hypothetical protein